jgi:hypothetical protein
MAVAMPGTRTMSPYPGVHGAFVGTSEGCRQMRHSEVIVLDLNYK